MNPVLRYVYIMYDDMFAWNKEMFRQKVSFTLAQIRTIRKAVKTSFSELFPNTSDTPISEAVSEHLDSEY